MSDDHAPILSLLLAWAAHRLLLRLTKLKPKFTAAQAAAETALGGYPPGA